MSYVGNVPTTAAFPFDQFSGNGSTTAFTLSYAPAGSTSIIVSISGVVQNPNTYSVSGTTLTFTPAPPTGTSNIAVLYLGLPVVATLTPGNTAYFSSSVFTATASQTVFTPSGTYQVGFINVIRNGSQLAPADYTATDGTTVTLASPCTAGDTVVIEVFNLTSLTGALPLTGGTVTGATTFNSTVSVNGANVSGFTGFKNRIINPGMVIDQRNAGASVTANDGIFGADRFKISTGYTSKATIQQSTTVPAGFKNSILITSSAATSTAAGDYMTLVQGIEGLNVSDLGWGAAGAATVTLSFWVRSSLTGTFGGSINNSGNSRSYVFSYTISAANTWEQKTVTIAGDTSGTWLTTNGIGLIVRFSIAMGSTYTNTAGAWYSGDYEGATGQVNVLNTNGATWYVTGVQLERGSNATSFEFRDYGRELAMCQRYCEAIIATGSGADKDIGMGSGNGSGGAFQAFISWKVQKRAAPSVTLAAASNFYVHLPGSFRVVCSSFSAGDLTEFGAHFNGVSSSGTFNVGMACFVAAVPSTAVIIASAEL